MNCIVFGADEYPTQKEALIELGNFLGLSAINYQDKGNIEIYTLVREDNQRAELRIGGNQFDGGFMNTEMFKWKKSFNIWMDFHLDFSQFF